MDLQDLISRLALALGIGLLIGLERGWRARGARPGSRAAGIRTFAISGLLGGVIGALAQAAGGAASLAGGLVLGLAFATHSIIIALFSRDENLAAGIFSVTTAVAGMLTFALGAYAVLGDMRIAAGVAVAATGVLALREELHGWVRKITWPELRSGLVLLAMSFIGLPILPDEAIGPFGGVNPREVWIIAIVLAGVSFLGYAAVKYFGVRRGLLLAAAAGGLASST
ncbi:MAG: MgtC/SapB family protein, partial [Xanthobacteraceae bacterium]